MNIGCKKLFMQRFIAGLIQH